MSERDSIQVRIFGMLGALRTERGLATTIEVDIPTEGITSRELADELELPHDLIEGVFCNHTVYGLDHVIHPGDRVAFVPYGTPGPHRFTLGLYDTGKGSTAAE